MSKPFAPKERPTLFFAPMVRAILEGHKTQTRRVIKPQPDILAPGDHFVYPPSPTWENRRYFGSEASMLDHLTYSVTNPFGVPGDRLWVREAWNARFGWPRGGNFSNTTWAHHTERRLRVASRCERVSYAADESTHWCLAAAQDAGLSGIEGILGESDYYDEPPRWMPSIHMPHWASRLTLEVVEVRAERLQDITLDDMLAEGVASLPEWEGNQISTQWCFRTLWDSLNAPRGYGWDANPLVWAVTFKRVEEA